MRLTFEKMKVKTEFSSYNVNVNFVEMKLGMITENKNLVTNPVELEWKLKNSLNTVIQTGRIYVKIGFMNTNLKINNLPVDEILTFEIQSLEGFIWKTIIYYGNMNLFQTVNEDYVFASNDVRVFGDVVFGNDRKLKLIEDWDVSRNLGNAIVKHENQNYLFAPSRIFTRRTDIISPLNFSPFSGKPEYPVKILIIPSIEHLESFKLKITPPSRINVIFYYRKFRINPIDDFFEQYDYKIPQNHDSMQPVSLINLLDYNTDFTNFEIEVFYDL